MTLFTAIPPNVRNGLYLLSALVGLALGATQVGYQAADAGFPTWLKVALSVYAFLAGTLGLTASANTPSYADVVEGDAEPPADLDRGATDVVTVLIVVVLVIVVLILAGFIR